MRDATALVELDAYMDHADHEKYGNNTNYSIEHEKHLSTIIESRQMVLFHLESLYLKLIYCLKWAVKYAYSKHNDVLEAGQFVQLLLDGVMKGHSLVR
jgi:hypothetical protein